MFLAWPRDHGISRSQLPLFTSDMEDSLASKNKVDLIRFCMAVDPLVLPGSQAIQITKVSRRTEQRDLLHLFAGKTDEIFDVLHFHN